ncbi:phosphotransferase family protein [Paenibacillus solanacearum]|uniref:phosphotransferase family protein n=1 Tax=Paenibacillus solanacearum TaxID=2048548 RepID=UPI001FEA8007|nr:aminoglycoside phosphotransferase family protein [Paenibacillus solanacearum]
MKQATEHMLPERLLQWAARAVHPDAAVVSVRQLLGGTSSTMHCLSVQSGGQVADYVLRQLDNEEWLQEEPDAAWHEAESLRFAVETGLHTPRIVAYDIDGSACGIPAVLMTRLEGTVDLQPQRLEPWLNGLAQTLASIHAVDADRFGWAYFTYIDVDSLERPEWSNAPERWSAIFDIVRGPRPLTTRHCFIHRDYHPGNVLWSDGAVSGVVDWVNACRGPAGIDVGQCRLDLAKLHGVEAADTFLSAYERFAGTAFRYDPYWDLLSVVDTLFDPPAVDEGWKAFGVTSLTDALVAERLELYAASLLRRAARE